MSPAPPAPVSRFHAAEDGLRLHVRDWPTRAPTLPIVCLPGLARTAADFNRLAQALSSTRRVLALDYRGRGLSERDPDWKKYDLMVENADIRTVLVAERVEQAIFVGTSRGGMHAMILAATWPEVIRGVVLNDIGPVLEADGLARIAGYVGKLPSPTSWPDAIDMAKRTMGAQFTGLDEAAWNAYAHLTFEEKDGRLIARYDPLLSKALEGFDLSKPLPTLWPQFEALKLAPVLTLRGENSDLLSNDTLEEMGRRHPDLETYVVPGQGHAPLLLDEPTIARIARFVDKVDPPERA